MKLKIGVFSFTCCEGCVVSFLEALNKKYFDWKEKLEIENIRVLKTQNEIKKLDIAFVEGAISTESELKKLKEIRKKSKKIIAFGSGAINGYPSNLRNNFSKDLKKEIEPLIKKFNQIKKVSPIKKFVKVDDEIEGCPVDENSIIKKLEFYLKQNA